MRIIAAAGRDLRAEVESGNFRQDLFYRLNVVNIKLPALRERKEDIPLLISHFIEKHRKEVKGKALELSEKALQTMMKHSWPGNVRELKNVIERAMILGEGDTLLMEHLPIEILGQASKQGGVIEGIRIPQEGISLEKVEEALVRQALKMTNGNQTRAAKLLDISRDALRYRMQKFGILDA